MENKHNSICDGAVRWALGMLSYSTFEQIRGNCAHLRNILSRGGFKVRPNSFRDDATVKRLIRVLRHDFEATRMLLLAQIAEEGRNAAVVTAYGALNSAWLEKNWRRFLRALADPRPWVVAMMVDDKNAKLRRIGERLLGLASFWEQDFALRSAQPLCLPEKGRLEYMESGAAFLKMRPLTDADDVPLNFPEVVIRKNDASGANSTSDENVNSVQAGTQVHNDAAQCAGKRTDAPDAGKEHGIHEKQKSAGFFANERGMSLSAGLLPLNAADGNGHNGGIIPVLPSRGKNIAGAGEIAAAASCQEKQRVLELESALAEAREARQLALNEKDAMEKRLNSAEEALEGAIQELSAEKDRQVLEEINRFKLDFLGLSQEPGLLEHKMTVKEQTPLDVRVKLALKSQKERDKRFGIVSEIKKEMTRDQELLDSVRSAIAEAISVEPSLSELEKELEEKIRQNRGRLERVSLVGEDGLAALPTRLLSHIQGIPLGNEECNQRLDEVLAWLASPMGMALLVPDECDTIRKAVERRKSANLEALYARQFARDGDVRTDFHGAMRNILKLNHCREELDSVHLVVDAYNVIKRNAEFAALEKSTNGFGAAREHFIHICGKIAPRFRKMTLVFDGELPTDGIEAKNEKLEVVWAAKVTPDQNADRYIVNTLSEWMSRDQDAEARKKRWVVTDDYGLIAHLAERQCCGAHLSGALLMSLLR